MLYNIIIQEPSKIFYVIYDHVTITMIYMIVCDISCIITLYSSPKFKLIKYIKIRKNKVYYFQF